VAVATLLQLSSLQCVEYERMVVAVCGVLCCGGRGG
jgi:hypothetical protein